ncbi:MAG: histidine kinase [Rubrobacteraceae bacterium]
MKTGIFSLRRLRWKLTLNYTLVAVVTLLVMELFVASLATAFLSSDFLPSLIVQQSKDNVAARLEPYLDRNSPDIEGLRNEVNSLFDLENSNAQPARGDGSAAGEPVNDIALDSGEVVMFVVDSEQELLVASPRVEGFTEGERFDASRFDEMPPILDAALEGEEDSAMLSERTVDGRLLMAAPLEDEDGQVIGAVVSTFVMPNLAAPILIAVGVIALLLLIPAAFLGGIFGFLTAWGMTRRIGRLAYAADAWSRGDFSVTTKDRSKDELGQLSRELNDMAEDLENLLQTRGELATLEARNRFARDLHDSVKQQVFATSMQIATARALVHQKPDDAEGHLEQAHELVRQAQKELNVLIHEMRPAALEDKGLAKALREYAVKWSEGSEIPSEVHVRGEREIPLEIEQTIFRVAQEALANVAKHSEASKVELDLTYTPKNLTLSITDDGRGFDPAQNPGEGFGLQSMRERSIRRGGHINVESAPGKGTRVTCVVPLDGTSPQKGEK